MDSAVVTNTNVTKERASGPGRAGQAADPARPDGVQCLSLLPLPFCRHNATPRRLREPVDTDRVTAHKFYSLPFILECSTSREGAEQSDDLGSLQSPNLMP